MNREIGQIREVSKILTEKRLRTTIDEDLGKKTTLFRMVVRGRGKDVQTAEYAELTSQVRHDSGAQSETIAGAMCGRQIREVSKILTETRFANDHRRESCQKNNSFQVGSAEHAKRDGLEAGMARICSTTGC